MQADNRSPLPAAARMFADTVSSQLKISCIFSLISSLIGYYLGAFFPQYLGFSNSIGVSGLISVVSGIVLFFSIILAPQYGVLGKLLRKNKQKMEILIDDIMGYFYRIYESNAKQELSLNNFSISKDQLRNYNKAIKKLLAEDFLVEENKFFKLTDKGLDFAKRIIKKHRLLESYLVENAGIKEDHVHLSAEEIEHVISDTQEEYLETKISNDFDPHGKPIPK
jgi:predicted transcriptional regulator